MLLSPEIMSEEKYKPENKLFEESSNYLNIFVITGGLNLVI
jgi:hypothetical protein